MDRPPARQGWVRRLLPWLRPHRRNVLLSFGAALGGAAFSAAAPLVQRHLIDDTIITHRSPLAPWLAVLVVLAVGTFGLAFIRRFFGGRVSLDLQFDLRNAIHDHLGRLDFAGHDELLTGQLVSRSNSDLGLLQGLLAFLPLMSANVLLLVVSLVVMFVLSPLLALVELAAVPALIGTGYLLRRRTFPANWDAQQREGEVAVVVEEGVTGVRVVKGFGQEARELDHLVARAGVLYGSNLRVVRLTARYQPLIAAIPQIAQAGVLALGGYLAIRHQLSLGTFLAFSTYLLLLSAPARQLSVVLLVAQQARAGAERIFDLLARDPGLADGPDARPAELIDGSVRLEQVSFAFQDSAPVLSGVDLTIDAGETVALVGGSGSGKSTLLAMVPRFYDPTEGAVRIDGCDLRDLTLDSLRSQIGVVFEESFLFSDSIGANIAYGRPDATEAEIEQAARLAEAHEFVSALRDGYATQVGERGLSLSGGQRQRICLARALLTDPRILLLDDATSAVDARVEERIHRNLAGVMAGRTTLLVAHRHSTLRLASRIVVLDQGRIVDQGTHDELQARSAIYRDLLAGPDTEDLLDGPAPVGGITPELWDPDAPGAQDPRLTIAPGGRGGGGPGGGPGWMGAVSATPQLLAQVAALPPVRDEADVDVAAESADDPQFRLASLLRPYRRPLALGLTLVALDALASLAGPILIRSGLDSGVARSSMAAVWLASGLFLAVTLADLADSVAETFVTGRTAQKLLLALRIRVWSQLQRLSIDFYEQEMGGRIMTRMTTDIDAFSNLLQTGLVSALVALFTFVGVGVALVVWNWQLGLLTLTLVLPLAWATALYRRRSADAYGDAREQIARVNGAFQESISGAREVQAYVRQERNVVEFRSLSGGYLRARVRAQRLVSFYFPFVQLLSDVGAVVVIGAGSVLIGHGTFGAGELIGFLLYLDLFFSPVQQLSQTFDSYQQASASRIQIDALMQRCTLTPRPAHPVQPGPLGGRITLDHVHFGYPTALDEALRGVDLEIHAGETVALVGQTGAGKSTVVKLLTRFYDPTAGAVLVDGVDLRTLDLDAYRHQLGYVPQEAHLFSGTIRDNIAYGRPDATDAEIEAAARSVGAHDLIATLRGGYLAPVTERGRSLSAGQRQLIALARAELVDPAVLLLDEATSNLDLATEARVSAAMGALARGRTTVVIAHRLQTARRADRVVVMDAGRVVEDGTHDRLVLAGGAYAEMWRAFETGRGGGALEPSLLG